MPDAAWDTKVRIHTFEWLESKVRAFGDCLPRAVLQHGFVLDDRRIPLVSPQGIFTPQSCRYPLSITTVANGPYPDRFEDEHHLLYRYRGSDPQHRDNTGLRNAMQDKVPLVYFFGVAIGWYQVIKPVFVTDDNPRELAFTIMADVINPFDENRMNRARAADQEEVALRRRYSTAAVQQRLHQSAFRERVLHAYREHCAMCQLKHRELLDAAHIIGDADPDGRPEVSNGLALCKIHHSAFDRGILGIRPDYVLEVRQDILEETDGPMLRYGLQELHKTSLHLPTRVADRPSRDALERRYLAFREHTN